MFTDKKGYFEFLREKNQGINSQFWIDFEEDIYKVEREKLNAEGPDEIVSRGVHYINVLQEFSNYFHIKKPNSKLIVWCGTHYDFISPFAKQTIFGYEKSTLYFFLFFQYHRFLYHHHSYVLLCVLYILSEYRNLG